MSCGPCKDAPECEEIDEDHEDYEALTRLYQRLFEERRCDDENGREQATAAHGMAVNVAAAVVEKNAAVADKNVTAADCCGDATVANESPVRRADRQLTALLRPRKDDGPIAAAAEGDVKHLTDRLPTFRSACRSRKPGTVNAAQFALDLERWMAGSTAGDHDVRRAAYDLASAEARCKHVGAVEAANLAVHVEPAGHLAEVAARYGAQSFADESNDAGRAGHDADADDTPVIVLAYVGNTVPQPHD